MKLQLNNFDKIIFDMDGVVTSELAYWQSAACGAYELLFSYERYGKCGIDREWCRKNYIEIYNTIMCGGKTVRAVKRLGVNTNWDLLYIVFCVSKYLNSELDTLDEAHFQSVCMFIENIDLKAPELYDALSELISPIITKSEPDYFKRGGNHFWNELVTLFNEWYNGTDEFEGIKTAENLLFPTEALDKLFKNLTSKGIRLGIGTGRPRNEIEYPLSVSKLDKYFDKAMYITYDDVVLAEAELKPTQPFAKPDPFVFLKAALGDRYSNKEILEGDYTYEDLSRVLIVGDSPSDLFAAQRGGFQFLAVLTGIEGASAEKYFAENNADYILPDILALDEYIE